MSEQGRKLSLVRKSAEYSAFILCFNRFFVTLPCFSFIRNFYCT